MASNRPRVLITHWVHASVSRFLRERFDVVANTTRETWDRERVAALARDCDAMMAFMPDTANEAFLEQCPQLRIIAAALKGPDNFDIAACTRHNVWFTLVPDLLTIPTAELAVALLLGITRRVMEGDDHIRSGRFSGWRPELYGTGVTGRTVGLIGMGAVAQAIAKRLVPFDVRILYTDPGVARLPDRIEALQVDMETLLAASHFVLPLTHLTPLTYHMIGTRALAQMKKGAFLVNVGRGSLVDEAAVAASLASGQLAGYAADVFEMEDWAVESRPREIHRGLLGDRRRTLFTPHLGSAVDEVREAIAMDAARNIVEALEGQRPHGAVNEVPATAEMR